MRTAALACGGRIATLGPAPRVLSFKRAQITFVSSPTRMTASTVQEFIDSMNERYEQVSS
jgi:hypothetical protein